MTGPGASLASRGLPAGVAPSVVPTFAKGPGVHRAYERWVGRACAVNCRLCLGRGDWAGVPAAAGAHGGGRAVLAAGVVDAGGGGLRGGATGLDLARRLSTAGVRCVVAAPSKLQRPVGDRIKTDARDALHLARLLRMDQIVAVRVPSESQEAARDLVRAREDVRGDLMRCRHRLSKLLLRHGRSTPVDSPGPAATRRGCGGSSSVTAGSSWPLTPNSRPCC